MSTHEPGTAAHDADIDLAQFDDDFAEAPIEERDFEPLPDGKYQVVVEKVADSMCSARIITPLREELAEGDSASTMVDAPAAPVSRSPRQIAAEQMLAGQGQQGQAVQAKQVRTVEQPASRVQQVAAASRSPVSSHNSEPSARSPCQKGSATAANGGAWPLAAWQTKS
jgi:hypothetical protein